MKSIEERIEELEKRLNAIEGSKKEEIKDVDKSKNYISVRGNFSTPHTGASFGEDMSIGRLAMVSDEFYAKLFAAFSSPERIKVIRALFEGPVTAKGLMEKLNFNTTGQVYHHLNFLEKATIITKTGNEYRLQSSRISSILMMLCGGASLERKLREVEGSIE